MYAVIWTDGVISEHELQQDCSKNGWMPVLVRRAEGKIYLPVFDSEVLAQKFGRRNIPRKWVRGTVLLGENSLLWIDRQGWVLERYDFPKKLHGDFGCEVIDNGYAKQFSLTADLT